MIILVFTHLVCPDGDEITEDALFEFLELTQDKEKMARRSFAYFDKDGSGELSRFEAK